MGEGTFSLPFSGLGVITQWKGLDEVVSAGLGRLRWADQWGAA